MLAFVAHARASFAVSAYTTRELCGAACPTPRGLPPFVNLLTHQGGLLRPLGVPPHPGPPWAPEGLVPGHTWPGGPARTLPRSTPSSTGT